METVKDDLSPTPGATATHGRTRGPDPTDGQPAPSGRARWGWRAFVAATVVMAVIGWFFAASMDPTAGPYVMDERYPFGRALRTWQVTVGFDWIAYAILFGVAGSVARRIMDRRLWAAIAVSFAILWFPHVAIGVAFVLDGA